jgi:cobalamin biosynthesis protein CobT
VLKAYEKTERILAEYLGERRGRRAFKDVLWEKGWPIFKELIDKQIEDEAKRQQEEDQKKEKDQQGNQGDQPKKEGQPQEGAPPQDGGQEKSESGEDKKDDGAPDEPKKGGGEKEEGKAQPRSWDDLSPEEQEWYRASAREKLTEEEREVTNQLQPKSIGINEREDGTLEMDPNAVPQESIAQADEDDRLEEEREADQERRIESARRDAAEAASEARDRLKERSTGLSENERQQYDEYYGSVKKYVNMLAERLDEVFPPQEERGWEGGQRRGKRIDAKSLAREIPTGSGKFFERKEVPEVTEAAFSLLIDVSGSMQGKKIQEALKAAILMAEAFSKKGIPFEISAFNAQFLELKGFEEEYFGKKKMEIMRLLNEVRTYDAYNNDDGYAVDTAARRLQKRLLENDAIGALIVISDGEPAPSDEHDGPEWELRNIVKKWSRQIPLIGVGIGPGMESTIKEYYDKNGLPVPDVNKLPQALLKILGNQLSRFEKRSGG